MPDALASAVAAILHEAYRERGIRQVDLAVAAGLSQSHVSKLLRGVRPITVDELDALCSALGLNVPEVIARAAAMRG